MKGYNEEVIDPCADITYENQPFDTVFRLEASRYLNTSETALQSSIGTEETAVTNADNLPLELQKLVDFVQAKVRRLTFRKNCPQALLLSFLLNGQLYEINHVIRIISTTTDVEWD